MTRAITDIKELVGEMPARGCEFHGVSAQNPCGRQAQWIARGHIDTSPGCRWVEIYLCNECLLSAQHFAESWVGRKCGTCNLPVNSAGDLLGPVMPL
ncbi:Uncharacterised protein [Mycobacteroides abscessus]|nr:Uncharacterised protein [Mycobacteroides abscessus]